MLFLRLRLTIAGGLLLCLWCSFRLLHPLLSRPSLQLLGGLMIHWLLLHPLLSLRLPERLLAILLAATTGTLPAVGLMLFWTALPP